MRRYPDKKSFLDNIEARLHKGWKQSRIDELNMQALQEYRIAAAFVVGALGVAYELVNNSELSEKAEDIVKQCKEVLRDTSVYINDPLHRDKKFSNNLKDAVKKADEAVVCAGNFLNNLTILFPEESQETLLEGRNICDSAFKRKSFS